MEEEDSDDARIEATRKRTRQRLASQAAKNKKLKTKRSKGDGDSDDDDVFSESMMYKKKKSVPGQLANCEICSKRFTVTPYSKTGPEGGLLCVQCSKRQTAEEKKAKTKTARKPAKRGRRQNFSNLLDGIAQRGAFSLLELCVKVGCPAQIHLQAVS